MERVSKGEIRQKIADAFVRMDMRQQMLWDLIKIEPERWSQAPYGDPDGFWAVAVIGRMVVWYNEIEEGFNRSRYTRYGVIDEYFCNQDELPWTVQRLLERVETGQDSGYFLGAPQPAG